MINRKMYLDKKPLKRMIRPSRGPNQVLRHTIKELYKEKNWDGLRKYLLLLEERRALPKSYRWQIAQASINMGKYSEALDYLSLLHMQEPSQPDVQLTILEAITKSGKENRKFTWLKKPIISDVSMQALQICYKIIGSSSSGLPLCVLYSELGHFLKIDFDEFDLLYHLKKDSRFIILTDSCYFRYSKISLNAVHLKKAA